MNEYINKDIYNQIPASERHFIKLSQEAAYAAVKMLEEAHIAHSATISEYRSVITVYKADSENAEQIAEKAAKAYPTKRSVIGNIEYKYIRDKKYIDTDAETAMKIAAILSGNASNRFSGIIKGEKATITVSGEKNAAAVRAMVDNIKNLDLLEALRAQGFERVADTNGFVNIRNIQTGDVCGFSSMAAVREMFYSPENDFFHPMTHRIAYREHPQTGEYYYYILKYNPADRNTAYVLRDEENKPYLFQSVDEAISFVQNGGIKITNIDEEIANWRELEREREDNAIFESNKKLIEQFPERNGDYIDLVRYNKDSDTFSWIYFNPDGDNGNGEFIDKTITKDDIFAAYSERISAETEEQGRSNFIAYLNQNCRENVIDIHSGYFADYADDYINYASRNFSYYFGISENSTAVSIVDDFVNILELNTEEVVKDKEAHAEPQEITPNSTQVELEKAAAVKDEFLNTIEIEKYSKPENGKVKLIGTKTYGEVFSELKAHLNKMGLIPDEYFELSFNVNEDEPIPDNWIRFNCNTNFGSSEGIYLDIDIVTEDNTVRFITGKTLGENVEDFLKMSRIGAECSMLLNGNGAVIRHSREKSQEINSKIEMSVPNGDSAKAEEIITEVETSFPNGDSAQADELNTGADTATMLISKVPELNTDTAVKIINAFEKATLDEWQDNNAKINRIKKAIYDIVGSEDLTERAFALISKSAYDFDTDKLNFSFGENGVNEWFTESKLLGDIVAENPKMSFALANAVIEYLDKKQHTEREIEGLNAGWYKKTDFKIEAVIDGKTYTYSGRFDIGDGLNTGGGSLIDHIKQINENILTSDRYAYNEQEYKNKAKSTLDVFVPFLIKNSVLTAEEKRILADIKFKNPIEYSAVRDFKENTDKMFKSINGFSADEIENLAAEYVRNIFEENGIEAYVVAGAVTGSRSRGLEGENSDIDIVFEIQSDLKEDALFNVLNENPYDFDGIKVDINPIRADETGTLETYLPEAEKYLEEKAQKRAANLQNPVYRQAVDFINRYAIDEFGEKADFSNTNRVGLAYTHNEESNIIVDVYADLDNFRIVKELDGKIASEQKFNSLEEMNKNLAVLDYGELVALDDEREEVIEAAENEQITAELSDNKAYIFSEIKFETGEEYIVPGVITEDNLHQTSAYKDIMERYADKDNIESLDDMIRVNISNYRYGSGDEIVPNTEETAYIIKNYNDVVNNSVQTGQTEFFMQFWRNIEDVLNELDDKTAEQHRTNPMRGDKFAEKTCIFPADYNSDYPDYYSAVTELKIGGEWLGTEEAVKKMNAQGNTDPAQIEALRVRTVSFDGVMRNEELNPEEFYIILDRTMNNQNMLKEAAELYDSKHGNIIPVYKKLIKEADAAGERDIYYENRKENVSCGRSLDYSVSRNSDTFSFDSDKAITDLLDTYSVERIALVIADRVSKSGEWDKRFSPQNVEWAKNVTAEYPPEMLEKYFNVTLNSHSVLINEVADKLRTQYDKYLEIQNKKEIAEKENFIDNIKNLNQLKKFLKPGMEFVITDHIRKECVGERRQLSTVNTVGFYSHSIDKNGNQIGEDLFTEWGKAGDWKFNDDVCTSYLSDKSLLISFKIYDKENIIDIAAEKQTEEFNNDEKKSDNSKEIDFAIYQMKKGDEYHFKRFMDFDSLDEQPNIADYDLIYNGKLSNVENEDNALDKIFSDFNINRPADFTGHSLSVRDVIVIGSNKAHYVDGIGFKDVPDFFKERSLQTEKENNSEPQEISADEVGKSIEELPQESHSPMGNNLPKVNDTVENEDGFFTVADIKGGYATLIEADTLFGNVLN